VPQNYKEAAGWFERAAKRGLAPSQFRLGTMYEKGLGVGKDLQEARRLYLAAADKGNPKAMHNIAVLYAEGIDGKPDYKSAVQWFRKAAGYGVADSQYNLAVLYARGIGVDQNLSESFKWFALAAHSGDQEAAKKRDEIASKLDKQALIAARLLAQSWSATAAPEEATTVKPPAGGWEQAALPAVPADKPKPRPRSPRPSAAPR
jgi:localization factor PodJL